MLAYLFFDTDFKLTGDGNLYTDGKLIDTGQCRENFETLSLLGTPHCMGRRSETLSRFHTLAVSKRSLINASELIKPLTSCIHYLLRFKPMTYIIVCEVLK
jgi:hypothetical protein